MPDADVVVLAPHGCARGTVLLDARGEGRVLQVTWRPAADDSRGTGGTGEHGPGSVVLALWQGDSCRATFRLEAHDVPALVDALVRGLAPAARHGRTLGA